MSGRDLHAKDEKQALLLEKSHRLIAQMEELIQRAKALTTEHKQVLQQLKESKATKK